MIGMNAATGKHLSGDDHLRQSIIDILTTPKGTRVLCREYGSDVLKYLDNPQDDETRVNIIAAAASALARWEKRLIVTHISVTKVAEGHSIFTITGKSTVTSKPLRIEGLTIYASTKYH